MAGVTLPESYAKQFRTAIKNADQSEIEKLMTTLLGFDLKKITTLYKGGDLEISAFVEWLKLRLLNPEIMDIMDEEEAVLVLAEEPKKINERKPATVKKKVEEPELTLRPEKKKIVIGDVVNANSLSLLLGWMDLVAFVPCFIQMFLPSVTFWLVLPVIVLCGIPVVTYTIKNVPDSPWELFTQWLPNNAIEMSAILLAIFAWMLGLPPTVFLGCALLMLAESGRTFGSVKDVNHE